MAWTQYHQPSPYTRNGRFDEFERRLVDHDTTISINHEIPEESFVLEAVTPSSLWATSGNVAAQDDNDVTEEFVYVANYFRIENEEKLGNDEEINEFTNEDCVKLMASHWTRKEEPRFYYTEVLELKDLKANVTHLGDSTQDCDDVNNNNNCKNTNDPEPTIDGDWQIINHTDCNISNDDEDIFHENNKDFLDEFKSRASERSRELPVNQNRESTSRDNREFELTHGRSPAMIFYDPNQSQMVTERTQQDPNPALTHHQPKQSQKEINRTELIEKRREHFRRFHKKRRDSPQPLRKCVLVKEAIEAGRDQQLRLTALQKKQDRQSQPMMVVKYQDGEYYRGKRQECLLIRDYLKRWAGNNRRQVKDPAKIHWRNVAVDYLALQVKLHKLPLDLLLLALSTTDSEMAIRQDLCSIKEACKIACQSLQSVVKKTSRRLEEWQLQGLKYSYGILTSMQRMPYLKSLKIINCRIEEPFDPTFYEKLCKLTNATIIENAIGIEFIKHCCKKADVKRVSKQLMSSAALYLAFRIARDQPDRRFNWDELEECQYKEEELYALVREICLIMKKCLTNCGGLLYYIKCGSSTNTEILPKPSLNKIFDLILKNGLFKRDCSILLIPEMVQED